MFPLQGSLLGGTKLTITGSGFGTNDTLVDVSVGDVNCITYTVTDTEIVCEIDDAAKTHEVTNKGTSAGNYRTYFDFSINILKKQINISEYISSFPTEYFHI